ncbi:MAG: right-handed parallel beta-helix repeat-containing protein, partial [Limisphaerales bacterium]
SVADCTARYDHGVGIFLDGGSTVRGCTVDYGDSDGIVAIGPSVITGNSSTRNGTGTANSEIRVSGANSKIEGNTMAGNYNTGLLLIGSPNLIIGNTSQNHGTNYNISILNKVGQILDFTGSSSVIITNANPWANIQF